jgi:ubiquinone/menaquinone biosynthesis C-methylase UbiE/uncharacterized protein YbaR (Trm112 family)
MISQDVLDILSCPITGQSMRGMTPDELETLNARISAGGVCFRDGNPLKHLLTAAVVKESGVLAYIARDSIFFMLADHAINLTPHSVAALATTKNSVMDFYNQTGWNEVSEGLYHDTLFEDLRSVATAYITKCHRRLRRFLTKGKYFFDIASGPVQYAEYLAYSEGCDYRVCVDFSLRALEAARKRLGTKGIFILGDITNLPIKAGTMDGGVSLHTIYHVHRDKQLAAFTELYRILKPDARAAVVYSWGKHSRIMRVCECASRLPGSLKRLAVKMIYRVLKPAKYRRILDLEAADKKAAADLYFDPYPYAWLARELPPRMTWSLTVWRALSLGFLRSYVPDNALGTGLLKFVYAVEERFPRLTAKFGQYPVILVEKNG